MKRQLQDLIEQKNLNLSDYDDLHDLYEALDYDGSVHELVDSMIDIYYYDLRKWSVDNFNFIDEAIDEGLCEGSDFHAQIQAGQYLYFRDQANNTIEEIFNEFNSEVA